MHDAIISQLPLIIAVLSIVAGMLSMRLSRRLGLAIGPGFDKPSLVVVLFFVFFGGYMVPPVMHGLNLIGFSPELSRFAAVGLMCYVCGVLVGIRIELGRPGKSR